MIKAHKRSIYKFNKIMEFVKSLKSGRKLGSAKFEAKELEGLWLNKIHEKSDEEQVPKRRIRKPLSSLKIEKSKINLIQDCFDINDNYEMIDTLGMGTYAYVRKARCRSSNQIAAIKVSRGSTSSAMLKSEYDILKQVSHCCIPRVFKFIENASKNESYMIMEYFEGVTLDTRIAEGGVMSEDQSKAVVSQLLSVVQYLHSVGVAHRDIKPENVLINDDNKVMLIDYNISKKFKRSDDDDKFMCVFYTQISTPLYSAPELKTQLGYNESVDVWGVGTILPYSTLYNPLWIWQYFGIWKFHLT